MIFYLKLFLLLFLSIKLAESSVESFNESYLELQRSFQIILQDGQIDNNCTLRNSRGQIEKNFHNLTWIWLLNDTIIIDKTNKLEIKTNEFSTRIFKKAVEFSDTGNYVCKVKYFEKNEKEISFDLMVIGIFNIILSLNQTVSIFIF